MQFHLNPSAEYDSDVKLKSHHLPCFSEKHLISTHPEGWKILGEVSAKKAKNPKGTLKVGNEQFDVVPEGSHSRLLWRRSGYLQADDDSYVVILKSRAGFFLILLLLLAAILFFLLGRPQGDTGPVIGPAPDNDGPVVINPDHPLPPEDENAEPIEDDDTEKGTAQDGGGSVSMIYSLESAIDLSSGEIAIYFKNPNASTHDVTVDMYIVSGGEEYLIAQSGILKAGYGLEKLTLLDGGPILSEGIYGGLFRLHCYDPLTGEQAMLVPEIVGLNITVTE